MDSDGKMQLQESYPFGDGRELLSSISVFNFSFTVSDSIFQFQCPLFQIAL